MRNFLRVRHKGGTLYLRLGVPRLAVFPLPLPVPTPLYTTSAQRGIVDGDDEEERSVCLPLNWWYGIEMRGDRWVWRENRRRIEQTRTFGLATLVWSK